MPMGDSITFGAWNPFAVRSDVPGGYRRRLGELLLAGGHDYDFVGQRNDNAAPGMDPHHNGNNGWRTDQMLESLPLWMTQDPDLILLKAGTNDILQQKPVPTALRDLENLILEMIMPRPDRRVVAATVIPITSDWGGIPKAIHTANANAYNLGVKEMVARHAAKDLKVSLADFDQQVVLTHALPAKQFFQPGDGVHPGQSGYDQLGSLWYAAITDSSALVNPIPALTPAKRSDLQISASTPSTVSLTWNIPEAGGSLQELWCREMANGIWRVLAILPPGATQHTAIGLGTQGRSHRFAINAVNANGPSGWSNFATLGTPGNTANLASGGPSSAFNHFNATFSAAKANDGSTATIWASTGMHLQWWQVDLQAAYQLGKLELVTRQDSDVAEQRRNFEILASNDVTFASFSILSTRGVTPLTHRSTLSVTPTDLTSYRYLRVRKTVAESFSIAEFRVFGTQTPLPPGAPGELAATPNEEGQAELVWTHASENHTALRIERRTNGKGAFFTMATLDAEATGWIDADAVTGKTYTYRVFTGNEAGESVASNSVTYTHGGHPSTYNSWLASHADLANLDEMDQQPGADPNDDGVPNLLAYAFDCPPLATAPHENFPRMATTEEEVSFRFIRNRIATDLVYQPEESDLEGDADWTPIPMENAVISEIHGSPQMQEVKLTVPLDAASRKFYRLRVIQPEPGAD
ncbi:MAG: GDSL-type esterase/lipase family protein [Akkermansiaceae bacterium]|nr:GDSL-type esterase/lipase family protein [Akkermansiaceae bacterium]